MRVLFIYPDHLIHRSDWPGYFYSGIAQLSAVLKTHGHKTRIIHITRPVKKDEYLTQVRAFAPQLVGFSGASNYAGEIARLSKILADDGITAPKIIGGIHATVCPEECIQMEGIDIVCRGEGEGPLVDLCEHIQRNEEITHIDNLWIRKDGGIVKNPLRPPIEDLDELPFSDREGFPNYEGLFLERRGLMSMMASRGCPFNCAYCSNKAMRKILKSGPYGVRFRSARHVINEIKAVRESYPFLDKVDFDDDILFFSKSWTEEFTELYLDEIRMPFICNARADLISEDTIKQLKRAGCFHLKIGLESGNETISNQILKRNITNEQLRRAFRLAREHGLRIESFNMVGLPEETPHNVLDTIKLNALVRTNSMQVSIFQPFPGTDLHDYCRKKGYLTEGGMVVNYFQESTITQDSITSSQVQMFRDYFKVLVLIYRMVFKLKGVKRPIQNLLDLVLTRQATSRILNVAYGPLNLVFRKLQLLKHNRKQHSSKP